MVYARLLVIGVSILNFSEKEVKRKTSKEIIQLYKQYRIILGIDKPYSCLNDIIPEDVI